MTESIETDQGIPPIIQQPNVQTSTANEDVEEESSNAKGAAVDVITVQESCSNGGIPNGPSGDTKNSDICQAVSDETSKSDDVATKSNMENLTAQEPQTDAVTGDGEVETLSVQPLRNRTHKDSFVSEDGEESSTTEESSQSTGQVYVIQFANAVENVAEDTTVKVVSTSRVETPEDHTSGRAVGEKIIAQESTPPEASVAGEEKTTPVEISQESETGKNDSTDSHAIPEDETNSSSTSEMSPKRLPRTVSFTIEATSKITREASIKIHSEDVEVVSSSSSPPPNDHPNEQQSDEQPSSQQSVENSDDVDDGQVIVNPETEEVSFRPRRRATSNTMQSIIRNPAIPEDTALDDFNDEDFPQRRPRPRISTLSRFRSSFSFGPKDRTLSRSSASFVDKSKNNFLSFHNVGYTVQQNKFCRRAHSKVILRDVSGIMRAGINAIMGPSGSGKTSLLEVISGRKDRTTGDVVINGKLIPDNFRCASGYVTQDETVTTTLTVRENILFSAQLRLPRDMTYEEKLEIVEEVIYDLGLDKCCDTRIGNEKERGVSGGERKRTAIAMELIVSPGVLFLDEPTSGLDSTTAISVIKILHELSNQGRVIILSIHQPRYSILKLFDSVILLSRGEMVYHGAVRAALPFFTNVLGVEYEKYNNPADFYIDAIIKNESSMDGVDASYEDIITLKKLEEGEGDVVNEYANSYRQSDEYKQLQEELKPILDEAKKNPVGAAPDYANNFFWQVWHVSIRTFKTILRDLNGAFTTIMAIIVLGIFSGVIFFQLDTTLQGQRDRVGAIFFNMLCNILPGLAGMEALVAERALFIHENANGFYSTGAYFVAKIVMDIIPFRILTVFLYCPIAYFITGLRSGADRFFFYILTMAVTAFAAASQVFMFSAVIGVYNIANPLLLMVITISMVFCGFFITIGNIQVWLRWLQYLSIYRYAFHAFLWNEFDNTVFCDTNPTNDFLNTSGEIEVFGCQQNISIRLNCNETSTLCGDVLLNRYQFDTFNVWWNFLIIIVMATASLVIGFVGLLCVTKRK